MISLKVQKVVLWLKASPRTASASTVSAFNDSPLEKKHEEGISAKLREQMDQQAWASRQRTGLGGKGFYHLVFCRFPYFNDFKCLHAKANSNFRSN